MKVLTAVALMMLVFGSGCASMMGSKEQAISVVTVLNGDAIEDAKCKLNNSEGTWFVKTPGSTTVHKSTSDLNVKCEKAPHPSGLAVVKSSVNGSMFGNILAGGIIGVAIDAGTGAGFDYPTLITVAMGETAIRSPNTEPSPVADAPEVKKVSAPPPVEPTTPPTSNLDTSVGRPSNCYLKGVIRFGEKFYYTPGDKKYYDIAIDPERGDRWLCTEDEASKAGFRSIVR